MQKLKPAGVAFGTYCQKFPDGTIVYSPLISQPLRKGRDQMKCQVEFKLLILLLQLCVKNLLII